MKMDEKAVVRAALMFAVAGGLLALLAIGAAFAGLTFGGSALMALGMILVAFGGFALAAKPIRTGRRAPPGSEAAQGETGWAAPAIPREQRFRRSVGLSAYTLGLYLVFVILTVVAIAGLVGPVVGLSGAASGSIGSHMTMLLAAATVAIAGAIPLAAPIPAREAISPVRQRASVGSAGVLIAGIVAGFLGAFGKVNASAGVVGFLLAVVALFLVVRWNARLPDVAHIIEWLETEEEVRRRGLPRAIVFTFSAIAAAAILSAFVTTTAHILPSFGDAIIAVAAVALVVASFGVGIQQVASRFEYGRDDLERARKRRTLVLTYLAWGIAAEIVVVVGLTLLVFASLLGVVPVSSAAFVVANHVYLFGLALLPIGATIIARTFVRSERRYTEQLRAYASLLASGSVLVLATAALVGSGVLRGAFSAAAAGAFLLGLSLIELLFFVRTRTLLPRVLDAVGKAFGIGGPKKTKDLKESIQSRMMFAYIAGAGALFALVAVVALSSLTPVKVEVNPAAREVGLFISGLIAVTLLGFVGYQYARGMRREVALKKEEDIGKRRLTPEEVNRYVLLGVAITFAAIFALVGFLTMLGKITTLGPLQLTPNYGTDFFVFAILVGIGPYAFYYDRELSRIQAIDAKFPEFLRDLAESQRSGMTLTEAVITASKGTYGALTWDIRKMAAQIEWGVSFPEALQRFAKRVRTPLIERTVSLIVQASKAGGNVVDILSAAADDSREIQLIIKERKTAMSIYIMIIYIAFLVFIGVIAILNAQFIPQVAKAVKGAAGVSLGGLTFKPFDENQFRMLFFHAAVIQGLGGGIVAGVMQAGKPVAGLKHAFLMVAIAYVLFRFVIGG
ncbi:MAG: type II secretion system F family protein [Thermoplasmatota archaeon]